jgi:hypothetical protein
MTSFKRLVALLSPPVFLAACVTFGAMIGHAHAAGVRGYPPTYNVVLAPGYYDQGGHFVGGTELRALVVHTGKIYAANGYWLDHPGPEGQQDSQVLVLNAPGQQFQQDVSFGGSYCNPATDQVHCALATSAMSNLTFSTDRTGSPVNVSILCAGTWNQSLNPTAINVYSFCKNNSDGVWYKSTLYVSPGTGSGDPQIRAFIVHLDSVTGISTAFAGEAPDGIFTGLLSTLRGPGQNPVLWSAIPEFLTLSTYTGPPCDRQTRVTAFAEANGTLYAEMCWQVWQRVDGPQGTCGPQQVQVGTACTARWNLTFTVPSQFRGKSNTGLRGMTGVTFSGSDNLLMCEEGTDVHVLRYNPVSTVLTNELSVIGRLGNVWNYPTVGYTICAYNDFPLWYDATGTGRRLVGLSAFVGAATPVTRPNFGQSFNVLDKGKTDSDGWYFLRTAASNFNLLHIPASAALGTPMEAVRTAVSSPWECYGPTIGGNQTLCAVYFGGYDGQGSATFGFPPGGTPTHNSAWVVELGPQYMGGR